MEPININSQLGTLMSCKYLLCIPQPIPVLILGWSIINNKRIYLGSSEAQLSWFAAEAKAIEVGGHLLEIYSNEHNLFLDSIRQCKPF